MYKPDVATLSVVLFYLSSNIQSPADTLLLDSSSVGSTQGDTTAHSMLPHGYSSSSIRPESDVHKQVLTEERGQGPSNATQHSGEIVNAVEAVVLEEKGLKEAIGVHEAETRPRGRRSWVVLLFRTAKMGLIGVCFEETP